jgi:hypothetical protein
LTFDHISGEKVFNIGPSWNQGRKALEDEIAKCEIVCSNCHAIRTKARARSKRDDLPIFVPFPKIPRLSRDIVITEKIDGTCGVVWVDGDGGVWAGSKNRWITPADDNHGFAAWVEEHSAEFADFGPGVWHGEWWGAGIQRRYGMKEKHFSLFNTSRWSDPAVRPACCDVVPVLYTGDFNTFLIQAVLVTLEEGGSMAAPGFMDPEGIVIFHTAGNLCFKKTLKDDGVPKSLIEGKV